MIGAALAVGAAAGGWMVGVPYAGKRYSLRGIRLYSMMRELDADLSRQNVDIPARPFAAIRAVSRKFGISLLVVNPVAGTPGELLKYAPLTAAIHDWYDSNYGERLKIDFSPGAMAVLVQGDLWELRMPRVWGTAAFHVSRKFQDYQRLSRSGPVHVNILQLINGLPQSRALGLGDADLLSIQEQFKTGWGAFNFLQQYEDRSLVQIALENIGMTVNLLMKRSSHYGESKWGSLQAAEKLLKSAIARSGGSYHRIHSLAELSELLSQRTGRNLDLANLIDAIQCGGGIRYGEVPCCQNDALAAHHASLKLVVAIEEAGITL